MRTIQTQPRHRRMSFIDGLRGLAAVAVVLVHTSGILYAGSRVHGDWFEWMSRQLDVFSHGVDVFFVISGFVIAHSISDVVIDARYARRFALRRSLRLDPPYWVAIMLAVAVVFVRRHIGHEHPPLPSKTDLIAHLFYLQRFFGFEHIIGGFWTLCLEVQFYLSFVVLIMVADRVMPQWPGNPSAGRAWATVAAFAVSLLWPAAVLPTSQYFSTWGGPHCHKFLIGAILWYAYSGRLPRSAMFISVGALGMTIALHRFGPQTLDAKVTLGLWAGLVTSVTFIAAMYTGGFYNWLSNRPTQALGRLSYPLYLVHAPVIEAMLGIQKRLALGSHAMAIMFLLAVYPVSLLLAWAMHVAVELPSIRLASKFKLKRDDLAGGVEGPAEPMITPTRGLATMPTSQL